MWHLHVRISNSKKIEHAYATEEEEQNKLLIITLVETNIVKNRNSYEQHIIYPMDAHM